MIAKSKKSRKSGTETMLYLQNKADTEFDLKEEEKNLKQKGMQLEALRKQNSTTQNLEKMSEHFQTQQLNLPQHQQMQMKQAQQQQQMMQQQSQLVLNLLEKLSKIWVPGLGIADFKFSNLLNRI